MHQFPFAALLAALAGATFAMARADAAPTTSPTTSVVKPPQKLPTKTDLVIESVEWVYAAPRASVVSGVASSANAGETVLLGPRLKITLRNAGTGRWASSGRVMAVVDLGSAEERAASAGGAPRRPGGSVREVAGAPEILKLLVPDKVKSSRAPFRGGVAIPGSLAPGETRQVIIAIEGKAPNPAARKNLLVEVDKFYTARVDIQARGDDQPNNNGAELVFRLDGKGAIVGPMFTPRETEPASRGTVEVRAPGS